jgi:double-strand break repair protein MRE11
VSTFIDSVVNWSSNILKFIHTGKPKNDIDLPDEEPLENSQGKVSEKVHVSTLVHQYLEAQNLGLLPENGMQRAVTLFVEKDDKDAIKE